MLVTLYKKSEKSERHVPINLKKPVLGPFWPHLAQKIPNKTFPENFFQVNFETLYRCNFIKNIRKFPRVNFSKNLENLTLG